MQRPIVFVASMVIGCSGSFVEATHASLPSVENRAGALLTSARVTAVTFSDDPLAGELEHFISTIGDSSYWKTTTSEYGVGRASATQPVHAGAAPAMIDDVTIQSYLRQKLDDPSSGWPAATDQSLYVLFFPATTEVTMRGGATLCMPTGGYHAFTALGNGQLVAYAVIGRCIGAQHVTLDNVTLVASHELVEAATDPFDTGYHAPPDAQYAWTFTMQGGEIGDLCEHDASSDFYSPELGYVVQRIWSNAAAAAGHEPCVPTPEDDVYFGAAPELTDELSLTFKTAGSQPLDALGARIPIGQSKTIPLRLFSDGPMQPMDMWAEEFPISAAIQQPGDLQLVVADDVGSNNGATLELVVTVRGDSYGEGHQYAMIYAQSGDQQHRWPIVISN
jgi:hypothetical protein